MRNFIFTILITTMFYNVNAQKLTLTDLQNICNKTNWEYVNQYLMDKGWEYFDSEKGNSTKYNTITWSFNKSYRDKAEAWLYLYTYERLPNKISYSVFNKPSYSIIQKMLGSKGYKLTNSEIEDNKIFSTYANSKFILKITTEKRKKDEDYSYYDESIIAYSFLLIKKSGIYDPDNGKKIDYWYGGDKIKAEYTLKNGKLNGELVSYYYNGNIKKTGTYSNGSENGYFKEYNEEGILEFDYSMKNGDFNGELKTFYENGQLKKSGNFIKGKKNGVFIEYENTGDISDYKTYKLGSLYGAFKLYDKNLTLRKTGKYINGNEDGYIKTYNEEGILTSEYLSKNDTLNGSFKLYYNNGQLQKSWNFLNGKKNGSFKEYDENGWLNATYFMKDDELNGILTIYDENKELEEKEYKNDLLNGVYTGYYYDDNNKLTLIKKGNYLDEKKEWEVGVIYN